MEEQIQWELENKDSIIGWTIDYVVKSGYKTVYFYTIDLKTPTITFEYLIL